MRVHDQPRELNAKQREWVAKEIDELVRCGVVCRAEKVRCAANLVLVEGQQSGQSYCVCYNAIDINAQLHAVDYLCPAMRTAGFMCWGELLVCNGHQSGVS